MRASDRSAVTLARVTVTRPTPGSRTSVARIWLTSSRTCSWMRCTRCVRAMLPSALSRLRDPIHLEHFDHVANLDVVEVVQAHAALEAGLDLGDVVLEALE